MNKAYIDPKKCDNSPMCPSRRSCPEKAITQEKLGFFKRGVPIVDPERCISCGACLKMCPHGAIVMRKPAATTPKDKKKKK